MATKKAAAKTPAVTGNAGLDHLATAIRRIASGGPAGPDGLELVAIALCGDVATRNVAQSLSEIADAINNLADAVREK
jgi:hypothetical protein